MNPHSSPLRRTVSRIMPIFIAGFIATIGLLSIQYVLAANVAGATDLLHANAFEPYLVKDISLGTEGSNPSRLIAGGNQLFFFADDAVHGNELWRTDGTFSNTLFAVDVISGTAGTYPSEAIVISDTLYFAHGTYPGDEYARLWRSDGTPQGTMSLTQRSSNVPLFLTNMSGTLYFHQANELWKSDGTPTGTVLIKDLDLPWIGDLEVFNGKLYALTATALWQSDGTFTGTVQLKQFDDSNCTYQLAEAGGALFFKAGALAYGCELWKTDGTPTGTLMVKDIASGAYSSSPSNLTQMGSLLFFSACDSELCGLWRSDGTGDGTFLVKDIKPWNSVLSSLTNVSGTLFFSAYDWAHGLELWKSDGTETGTGVVRDILPGGGSSSPSDFVVIGDRLFFAANDGVAGRELWTSAGTTSSTILIKDILPRRFCR